MAVSPRVMMVPALQRVWSLQGSGGGTPEARCIVQMPKDTHRKEGQIGQDCRPPLQEEHLRSHTACPAPGNMDFQFKVTSREVTSTAALLLLSQGI